MLNVVSVRCFDAPPVNRREILRYAGCREESEDIARLIDECLAEALPVLTYGVCWAEFPLPESISSRDLRKNLDGCRTAVVFAATVGLGVDRLIARYGRLSPSKALIMQAIGAERIESLCDAFEDDLRAQGYALRPRFSPGYGDLPLSAQKEIFAALNCHRHIGLSLNESLLMSPGKSVTAIIGISDAVGECIKTACDSCEKRDCQFRRKSE